MYDYHQDEDERMIENPALIDFGEDTERIEQQIHRAVERLMNPWMGEKCWCGEDATFTWKDNENQLHNLCKGHRPLWVLKRTRDAQLGPN